MKQLTVKQLSSKIKTNAEIFALLEENYHSGLISDEDLAELWAELEFDWSSLLEAIENIRRYIESYLEDV